MEKTPTNVRQEFVSPSAAYRGKPFWSWNGELRGEELVRQAHIMKEMGLGGFFMHSRSGLITEYLGEEWFNLINEVADAAEADGMEAWLYDEDRWPSGSAGGKVTIDPQYRMKSVYVFESAPDLVTWDEQSFALYVGKLDGINLWAYEELDTASIACGQCAKRAAREAIERLAPQYASQPGEWKAIRFAIVPDPCASVFNGTTYIDTMSRKATEKFIEMTHEEYRKHCGDRLGRSIKGIFSDEPHRGVCLDNLREQDGVKSCALCYTDDIFEEFEKRYGFACRPILPELFYRFEGKPVAPVKLHYIDLADNLFLERFATPIHEWCKKNGIIFTGHVLHEDSLMNQTVPEGSLMRFYEHMGYPGVDCLTEYNQNYWIVKQVASAARQLGKKWMLSELYGCTGWQFDFKGHKAVGDWQALFGINIRCQHLSWYTMEGEAKRDYPASVLHQSPWYKDYKKVEDYFARFGLVMSEGDPDCNVLLLNPIESLWCQAYAGWAQGLSNASPDVEPYERRYVEIFHMLTDHQIDFDYGEEEMMSRMAKVEIGADGEPILRVGQASYRTVIVANMLTIRPTTVALLKAFMAQGGKVIFAGDVPTYVDAVASEEPKMLSESDGAVRIPLNSAALVSAVKAHTPASVCITDAAGEAVTDVYAQVRKNFDGDGYAVVILNTHKDQARRGLTLKPAVPAGYCVQEWNLESGERLDASEQSRYIGSELCIATELEPAGTRCYVLRKEKEQLPRLPLYDTVAASTLKGDFSYTMDEANVCVLDWVKWRFADGEWQDEVEVLQADRQVRSKVGIEWRGGDMLQPWYAKKYDQKVYGELQLSYEFFIDQLPEGTVYLAGERPEWNAYRVNGIALTEWNTNDFWVDDCFKRMAIPAHALKQGRNEVTVDVTFKRTTNIEACYLVGSFGVALDTRKRTLVALPKAIGCDNYQKYRLPFYTGCMTFHILPEQYKAILGSAGENADRILLTPDRFTGGCAKVRALGKETVLGWDPYEADITEAYRRNAPIDVTIVGTRINVFGPLHEVAKPAWACGPGNFVTGGDDWTDDYSLLSSGVRGFVFKARKIRK